MKMKRLALSVVLGSLGVSPLFANPAYTINNKSGLYLYSKESNPGCPKVIAPGQTTQVTEYWCGFIACGTSQYSNDQGCLEFDSNKSSLTQGGYATWFGISFGDKACTVPEGNTYQCNWNNDFTLDYLPVKQKYSAGEQKGKEVVLPKPKSYQTGPIYRGVNVSGLEYDGTFLDALYQHPDTPDMLYFTQQGVNTVRLPIRAEFVLADNPDKLIESHDPMSTTINTMYVAAILDTTQKYLASGLNVIIDLHNYMRFCPTGAETGQANEPTDPIKNKCKVMSADQLQHIWGVIADKFSSLAKQYPNQLIFGLMNEPYSIDSDANQVLKSDDIFNSEVAAIKEIRKLGLENLIILSGNYWDPLHGWVSVSPSADQPNGQVFTAKNLSNAGIANLDRIAVEMHQYFDSDYSGRSDQCISFKSYDDFKAKLNIKEGTPDDLASWMKDNRMKVFLTEFGAADNETCRQDLNYMMQYVNEHAYDSANPNNGGFIGWTAWRTNRHGGNVGFSPFNYLQKENYNVYGGQGSKNNSLPGTGIAQGLGNGLMDSVFAKYLSN